MMEVRLNIDDAFLKDLQEKVGGSVKATDLTRDALTIFNWAVQEAAAGRVVLSTSATGQDVHRLVMPTLSQVQSRAKQQEQGTADRTYASGRDGMNRE